MRIFMAVRIIARAARGLNRPRAAFRARGLEKRARFADSARDSEPECELLP